MTLQAQRANGGRKTLFEKSYLLNLQLHRYCRDETHGKAENTQKKEKENTGGDTALWLPHQVEMTSQVLTAYARAYVCIYCYK